MKLIYFLIALITSIGTHAQSLVINEIMPKNGNALYDSYGNNEDWIEIYNSSNSSVDLSKYYLSNSQSNKLKWRLPNQILASGDFVLIFCSNRDEKVGEYHSNFKLGNSQNTLGIYLANGATVHELAYDSMPENVSYGPQADAGNNLKFFSEHTAGYSNSNVTGFDCFVPVPQLNKESGKYTNSIPVQLVQPTQDVTVRYTQNGQRPNNTSSIFTNTTITPNTAVNLLSMIPTNPGLNGPVGDYTVLRMNNRGYAPPYADGQNINVLSLKAFKQGCISSPVVSYTYVIDIGLYDFGKMPIMSICMENFDLFNNDSGIYVYGNQPGGNYSQIGNEWEREGYFQFYDPSGNEQISQRIGIELHGNGSRHSTHKNLRITAKTKYGKNRIDNTIFEDGIPKYKSLIVRSAGHRPDCMPRDELAADIVKGLNMDIQEYETGVLYINGEYWGINTIKERFNEDYLNLKYDVGLDNLSLLQNAGSLEYGNSSDSIHYTNVILYAEQNDLNDASNYAYMNTQMDMDSYLHLMSSQIYLNNGDWPYNNMRFWRKRVPFDANTSLGHDGRWRWMFFDLDGGFGGTCGSVWVTMNNLKRATIDTGSVAKYNRLFNAMMSHQKVRNQFINVSCDLLNSYFSSDVVLQKLQRIEQRITPEMMRHVERFRYPSNAITLADRINEVPNLQQWANLLAGFNEFANRRPYYARKQMKEKWLLADTSLITLDVNNTDRGHVQINSIHINEQLPGVNSSVYPWQGMYFDSIPVTLVAHAKPGYKFSRWMPSGISEDTVAVILDGDSSLTAVFEVDPDYQPLMPPKINELLADNQNQLADEYGEFDDWFEIYNPNSTAVDLNGYYLTDNPNNLTKYKLGPNKVEVGANDFLLLWADDQTGQGVLHTNFKLDKNGEYLALVAPNGQTVLSDIAFGAQTTNYSYGSEVDGTDPWIEFLYPTPGYSNLKTNVSELEQQTIDLYPNPARNGAIQFNILVSGTIYSASGVAQISFEQTNRVNVSSLTTGPYFVKIRGSAQVMPFVKL